MVVVVAEYDLMEPCTNLGGAIVHPALKLALDGFELRLHPLFRCDPPDGEGSGLVPLPTEVGEAQERKGLRSSLSTLFRSRAA